MSQGYVGSVRLGGTLGTGVPFQNATIHVNIDQIDTSCSMNADGTTNDGFSDTEGDLGVIMVDIDTVVKDTRAMYLLTLFEPGFRYPSQEFEIEYNGEGYQGTGIYVIDKSLTFRVPGEARIRMSFRTLQSGYELTTFA